MVTANENCTFCHLQNTTLFYEDDEFIAFKDIRPATKHHYLVIPRMHMKNVSSLKKKDILIVKKMVEIGQSILEKESASIENVRFGFHLPPFNSIAHLHLHVISSVDEMGFLSRLIFRPDSYWFMTANTLLERLEKMDEQ
ncbi:adenosine 5'-monophosphoramidase HINT3 [Parasteatoda tepidariorum]|uniref:adenosine 5'-monophosphoramidase HINT3 n=1 Tax=Parasteatoda tepidariorum TaxID=114398 RepID=UPI001C728375|nr:histidine triad nucleotide-binding protein 3 [Parasteatoda tepidariorum]